LFYVVEQRTKVKQKLEMKDSHLAEDSHVAQKLHRLRCEPGLAAASHGCLLCFGGLSGLLMINQSTNVFNVLGDNWEPTDKKFSSVNSYRQDLLPTCKAFPKETTTCIWFTQSHKDNANNAG